MVTQGEVGPATRDEGTALRWHGQHRDDSRGEAAWVRFGAIIMVVVGVFSVVEGVLALAAPMTYVAVGGTVLAIDLTVWGWVHLVTGVLVLVVGIVLTREDAPTWSRIAGIVIVTVSLVVQLAWLPAQPIWSIIMVALGMIVLRALVITWSDERA